MKCFIEYDTSSCNRILTKKTICCPLVKSVLKILISN